VPTSSKVAFSHCDDTKLCTMNDHCVARGNDGRCVGREYRTCLKSQFTLDPLLDCEECDGEGGCVPRPGHYVGLDKNGKRTCGCRINGVFTAHMEDNPDNQCQQCNLAHSNTDWYDKNGASCVHSNPCTKFSTCKADSNPNVRVSCQAGQTYKCDPAPCAKSRRCNYEAGCIDVRRLSCVANLLYHWPCPSCFSPLLVILFFRVCRVIVTSLHLLSNSSRSTGARTLGLRLADAR